MTKNVTPARITVDVQLSYPTRSNDPRRVVSLTVTDRESGISIVDVEFDAAQFTALLSTSMVTTLAVADVAEAKFRTMWGNRYVYSSTVPLPEKYVHHYGTPTQELEDFAERTCSEGGWEGYRWVRTNRGLTLGMYRWES